MQTRLAIALVLTWFCQASWADGHPVTMWLAEGAQNRVYLLGSVHLLRESDHPLPAVIDAAYEDAESIVMEIDMDDIDPFAMQGLVTELGLLPDDESLSDIMGNEMYAQAYEAAEELDIPLDMLARSEPWLAAITVEEMLLMRLGFNPMLGVEMHLTSRAIRDGKPVEGFETIEEQLRFMDELSIAAQNEMLLQTLRESADLQSIMDDVINAWRRGDTTFLEETLLADMQQYEELNRILVVDRNHRWMKTIRELLTLDDDYLIVVGALHMVGEDGVPNLLKASGVAIQQMQETLQD